MAKSPRTRLAHRDAKGNDHATKKPFNIDVALRRIRAAVEPYPKAALFELADDGFDSPFEQLVACMISIRTRDEVTTPTARELFAVARTPQEMSKLTPAAIDRLIRRSTFHQAKAVQIRDIARRAVKEFGGKLPCDLESLLLLRGVGPKCANLVLGIACDQPSIGVDIHVHRVVNRWGYVDARSPEATMLALQKRLPRTFWIELNALLVPFGKHICTGRSPHCSTCPVLEMCQQVGVTSHR